MESSLTPTNSTSIDSSSSSSLSSLCSPASSSMDTQPSRPFFFGRRVFAKKNNPQHPHEEKQSPTPPCFFFLSRKTPPTTTDSEDSSAATTLKRKERGLDDDSIVYTAKNKLVKFDSPTESCFDTKDAGEEAVLTELPLFPVFQKNNSGISSSTVTPKKSVSDNLPNLAKFKNCRYGRDEELQMRFSTELRLNIDPWLIKRRLTASDIGHLSRLLVETKLVQAHILPVVGPIRADQIHTAEGLRVTILDVDTGSRNEVIFKKWLKPSSYVFLAGWREQFVKIRGLAKGDEIGLVWDAYNSIFYFSVLARAALPLRR